MRWQRDETDLWCEQWGAERRKLLGMATFEPRDRLGKLSSTLGAVREDAEGASQGVVNQAFPECYSKTSLLVNRAWKEMDRHWRPIIEAHYVYVRDTQGERIATKQKARFMNITTATYWKYLGYGKSYIHSFVTIFSKYDKNANEVMETHETPMNNSVRALA